MSISSGSAWQHAVEHVDTAFNRTHQVVRLTHAHEITRAILWELRGGKVQCGEHGLLSLAHGQTADRISIEPDIGQLIGTDLAQIFVERALLNTEQGRPFRMFAAGVEALSTPLRPTHAHFHARGNFVARTVGAGAFVKSHHDVAAQKPLDFHAAFRCQHMLRPIDVAAEFHALLSQLPQVRQTHNLITAAVGEDRPVPVHEFVKTAELCHTLRSRAQHQVVSIAKDYVRARLAHRFRLHGLYGCRGADRHESRRTDLAAVHGNRTRPRSTIDRLNGKRKTIGQCQISKVVNDRCTGYRVGRNSAYCRVAVIINRIAHPRPKFFGSLEIEAGDQIERSIGTVHDDDRLPAGLGDSICILRQGHPVENPPVEIEACEAGHAVFDAPIGVIGNAVSRSCLQRQAETVAVDHLISQSPGNSIPAVDSLKGIAIILCQSISKDALIEFPPRLIGREVFLTTGDTILALVIETRSQVMRPVDSLPLELERSGNAGRVAIPCGMESA